MSACDDNYIYYFIANCICICILPASSLFPSISRIRCVVARALFPPIPPLLTSPRCYVPHANTTAPHTRILALKPGLLAACSKHIARHGRR